MSKAPTDWMPLNVAEYLADTMGLITEQHGAYLLLIMHYWKNRGPLKNDKKSLQSVTKISWKKTNDLMLKFFHLKDGFWHHKRIDSELSKALELKEKRQQQTANARANRHGKHVSVTDNVTKPVTTHTINHNHNLTTSEKDSNHHSITSPPSPPHPEGVAAGVVLNGYVEAFDHAGREVWGEQIWGGHRPFPLASDFTAHERLRQLDSTPDDFKRYCLASMQAIAKRGGSMPGSPSYFVKGFAEHLAGVGRPIAVSIVETPDQRAEREATDAEMEAIRNRKKGGTHGQPASL